MNDLPLKDTERTKWRLGLIAALAMTFLALLPQLHLWILRGTSWQGTYVSFDIDEVAYGSYLNALIDGRPRRNDPYTGRDDTPEQPRPESLHSIQFLPAYTAALPARAFGLSVGTVFVILRGFAAFASTLALFWLLLNMTRDSRIAVAGAIIVLCLGGLAGEPHDAWRIISWRGEGEPLPFLRRYVPALVFPLFLVLVGLVWRALQSQSLKSRQRYSLFAGFALGVLIFSYFFLWTAAIAWLFIIAVLWLSVNRGTRREAMTVFAIIAGCAAVVLVPYAYLLAHRAPTVDEAQLLTQSRSPIISFPVVMGIVVLIGLIVAARIRSLNWRSPLVIFTASLALLPAVTFNQQLISGMLLQPVHYGRYSSNYACVLAAFLLVSLIWHRPDQTKLQYKGRAWLLIATIVFGWAMIESEVRTARFNEQFHERDEALRVPWRLRQLAKQSAAMEGNGTVVFCSDLLLSDRLPNFAPQPVLWATHLFVFSGSSAEENRERLYQQLYFSGIDQSKFRAWAENPSFLQLALFGWERMNRKPHVPAITAGEIQREAALYMNYVRGLESKQSAPQPIIGYVVIPATDGLLLKELDRWYMLDAGERVGEFILYRARLR